MISKNCGNSSHCKPEIGSVSVLVAQNSQIPVNYRMADFRYIFVQFSQRLNLSIFEIFAGNFYNNARKGKQCNNVKERHKAEHNITKHPDGGQRNDRAKKVHTHKSDSVPENRFEPKKILSRPVSIIAPTNGCGDCKKENGKCHDKAAAREQWAKPNFKSA